MVSRYRSLVRLEIMGSLGKERGRGKGVGKGVGWGLHKFCIIIFIDNVVTCERVTIVCVPN